VKYLVALLISASLSAAQRYQVTGMVLTVDAPHRTVVVSHDAIPGYMDAMAMPYRVTNPKELEGLKPGQKIDFALTVNKTSSHISDIHIREYENLERDPTQARRLDILDQAMRSNARTQAPIGETVPDFHLLDQHNHAITLSELTGKVVAITFIYTRCPLPDYCFRMSNNLGRLQKRFKDRLGRDVVLLSITFDPDHDTPEVLAQYAATWKADVQGWHFLTGPLAAIKEVCATFGMNYWPDEGLMTHSLHTVIIDRKRKLVANIEGNQFTAAQLGDLVEATLTR